MIRYRGLEKLGIKLDKRTIARIIEDFRTKGKVKKGLTQVLVYKESFIKSLCNGFFKLDTIWGKRFYIFFIIHLQSRQIIRYAVTTNPTR